jgi:hypothetical protein
MEGVSIVQTGEIEKLTDQLSTMHSTITGLLTRFMKPYLSTKDVCDMINKSENWVLLHKEELGYCKKSGALLFKRKDIEDWIDEGYVKPLRMDVRFKRAKQRSA